MSESENTNPNLLEKTTLLFPHSNLYSKVLNFKIKHNVFNSYEYSNTKGDVGRVNYGEVIMVLDKLKKCTKYTFKKTMSSCFILIEVLTIILALPLIIYLLYALGQIDIVELLLFLSFVLFIILGGIILISFGCYAEKSDKRKLVERQN